MSFLIRWFGQWQHLLPLWLYVRVGRFVYSPKWSHVNTLVATVAYARGQYYPWAKLNTMRKRYAFVKMRAQQVLQFWKRRRTAIRVLALVLLLGACGRVVTAPPMCDREQVVRTVYSYTPAGDSIPALIVEYRCVDE